MMRSWRALFLLLCFTLSYGRCGAEKLGALAGHAGLACCAPVSAQGDEELSLAHVGCHHEKLEAGDCGAPPTSPEPESPEEPPCATCGLLDEGFVNSGEGLSVLGDLTWVGGEILAWAQEEGELLRMVKARERARVRWKRRDVSSGQLAMLSGVLWVRGPTGI